MGRPIMGVTTMRIKNGSTGSPIFPHLTPVGSEHPHTAPGPLQLYNVVAHWYRMSMQLLLAALPIRHILSFDAGYHNV